MMPSFIYERRYRGVVVGVDEAGMGCWAGPVFAGAAWVPETVDPGFLAHINDSKKLTPKKRSFLFDAFQAQGIIATSAFGTLEEIETLNIRQASFKAMERALLALPLVFHQVLVDGCLKPSLPWPIETIIKGDQKSYSIAAASIAAKVSKDRYMAVLAKEYPLYAWDSNQGYGTAAHQEALAKHGVTPHHRRTYAPIRALLYGTVL